MGGGHHDRCDKCHEHRDKCKCKNNGFGCAFKTAGIIGVWLIVVIAAASFTTMGIQNIYRLGRLDANIFGNANVRVDEITYMKQQAAVSRASDYLKSNASFLWLYILAAIVPTVLLCCIDSMCKNNEGKYFWFTRFGLALTVLVLIIVAHGIATLYFTSRATHFAGIVLIGAAIVAFFSALCLGASWRSVIQLVVLFICLGIALYYLVVSPGYNTISGIMSQAIVP